jgi:hypothetical protein
MHILVEQQHTPAQWHLHPSTFIFGMCIKAQEAT